MGLIGINMPSNRDRKPSTLEKIALGTKIATDILGTGNDIYKTVNPPKKEADPLLDTIRLQLAQQTLANAPLDKARKQQEVDKGRVEADKRSEEEKYGRPLSAETTKYLIESQSLPTTLVDVFTRLKKIPKDYGVVTGKIASNNPWNAEAQLIEADIGQAAQEYGRFMEGGVLKEADIARYRKQFPALGELPEVRMGKAKLIFEKMQKKAQGLMKGFNDNKFDVRAFSNHPILTLDIKSVLDAADNAGEAAKTINAQTPAFKPGDKKNIGGVDHVRGEDGIWRPQ